MESTVLYVTSSYLGREFRNYVVQVVENGKRKDHAQTFLKPFEVRQALSKEANDHDVNQWFGLPVGPRKKLIKLVEGTNPLSKCQGECEHTKHTGKPTDESFIDDLQKFFSAYELQR